MVDVTETVEILVEDPDAFEAVERKQVKALAEEYEQARKFDEAARKQYAIDRRYASGMSDETWAVDANLIGSYVDVLVSFLYARDPEVSARPANHVETAATGPEANDPLQAQRELERTRARRQRVAERQDFAATLQIVVSRLWERGKLKPVMRKCVRSGLAVGSGWLKAVMLTQHDTDPLVSESLNDLKAQLKALTEVERSLDEAEHPQETIREIEQRIEGLETQLQAAVRATLAIDFVPAEDMQVSLDVRDIDDFLEAAWVSNASYMTCEEAKAQFPRLSESDIQSAIRYAQRKPSEKLKRERSALNDITHKDAEAFTEGQHDVTGGAADTSFVRVVELWDQRDHHVKTMIEGVHKWAKEPFVPAYTTTRFFPYFLTEFFRVDGKRHAQSLSWRLHKLQDEYAATRSGERATKRRSIPGVLFDAGQVDPQNARKITESGSQEMIGVELTNPSVPLSHVFTEKPVARIDPRIFDTSAIVADMEKISGVQEALQSSSTDDKTATQAEIEHSGFQTRTGAERDHVEETLGELAQYSAELALQAVTDQQAQRMAGPEALWPEGLDRDELTLYLDVDVEAGSTGRPNTAAERQSWSAVLPLLRELMVTITEQRSAGNNGMADALIQLLRETLRRTGDRIDVERFLPPPTDQQPGQMAPTQPPQTQGQAGPGSPGQALGHAMTQGARQ